MFNSMKVSGVIIIIVGIVFVCMGFYKKNVYEEPGKYDSGTNAYVGGDAYNLIINAEYFAGYSSVGGALIVVGGLLFAAGAICGEIAESREKINDSLISRLKVYENTIVEANSEIDHKVEVEDNEELPEL